MKRTASAAPTASEASPGELPKSQLEAKSVGQRHYFTGRPCKRSHVGARLASTGQCLECLRERSLQQYREAPTLARERSKKYRESQPLKVRALMVAWTLANKQHRAKYKNERYLQNAEANRAAGRARYAENAEVLREAGRLRMARLKLEGRLSVDNAKKSAHTAARRASSLRATPAWFGEFDKFVLQEAQSLRMLRNRLTQCKWEVDHALPLRSKWVSGLHCAANIQVIPKALNNRKSNRNIYTEQLTWVQAL